MTKIPNSKRLPSAVRTFWSLEIVIWNLFVIWCLELDVSYNGIRCAGCVLQIIPAINLRL